MRDDYRRSRHVQENKKPVPWLWIAIGSGVLFFGLLSACVIGAIWVVGKKDRQADKSSELADKPSEQVGKQKPPAPSTTWEHDDVVVSVGGATEDVQIGLMIAVTVQNYRKRSIGFSGWRHNSIDDASITDNSGKRFSQKPYIAAEANVALQLMAAGQPTGPGLIRSDAYRVEFLMFPLPAPGTEYFDLRLNAKSIGQSGTIKLRIPAKMWKEPK